MQHNFISVSWYLNISSDTYSSSITASKQQDTRKCLNLLSLKILFLGRSLWPQSLYTLHEWMKELTRSLGALDVKRGGGGRNPFVACLGHRNEGFVRTAHKTCAHLYRVRGPFLHFPTIIVHLSTCIDSPCVFSRPPQATSCQSSTERSRRAQHQQQWQHQHHQQ